MRTDRESNNPKNRSNENLSGIQKDSSEYSLPAYLDPSRFSSYGYQFKLAYESGGMTFVNVGSANRVLSDLLSKQGRGVINLDLDFRTKPEVLGVIPNLPFKNKSFDASLCFQVLEHLPFSSFAENLVELSRISRILILSLPDISITRNENKKFQFYRRFHMPKEWSSYKPRQIDVEHFWEIGDGNITLDSIMKSFSSADLSLVNHFRNDLNRYHHFFVLNCSHN